jgi:hypothetical protein
MGDGRRVQRAQPLPAPWWVSPAGINLGFLLPTLLLIAYVGASRYSGLTIRGIHFLSSQYIVLGVAVLAMITVGGWIGSQIMLSRAAADNDTSRWDFAAMVVGCIALCAYLIFFRDFVTNPSLLLRTLTGSYRPDRSNIALTVGVTSLVNFAPVFFSIYAYRMLANFASVKRRMHLLCVILLCFTAFRVYAWSERLALIEFALPFGLSAAMFLKQASRGTARALAAAGPFIALPLLILYFGIAESVRSWSSATYQGRSDFWEFAVGRLASYYYTSLNNGAGMLATGAWPSFQFEYTLDWLHKAPIIGHLFSSYVDLRPARLDQFLRTFGDLEFNSPSGIYAVVLDLGLPLGLLYFAVVGMLGGALFQAYRSGMFFGVLLYPMFFLSFLEVFRYPYLGAPRAFTWALGILVAMMLRPGTAICHLPVGHRARGRPA